MSWKNIAIIGIGLAVISLPELVPQLVDVTVYFVGAGSFIMGAAGVKRPGDVKG